jgi:predicted RNase H-like nuclease (RuvC/YqgF family)
MVTGGAAGGVSGGGIDAAKIQRLEEKVKRLAKENRALIMKISGLEHDKEQLEEDLADLQN